MNAMALDVNPFAVRVELPHADIRELNDLEIDYVNGGENGGELTGAQAMIIGGVGLAAMGFALVAAAPLAAGVVGAAAVWTAVGGGTAAIGGALITGGAALSVSE